jgi:hypothetical protein
MLRKLLCRNSTRNGTVRCIDEWFASVVKPKSFYETYAAPTRKQKCYFYNIDLQGRVFLGVYEVAMPLLLRVAMFTSTLSHQSFPLWFLPYNNPQKRPSRRT